MRKVRNTLPIVFTALAILGLLAVAGHAGKPAPVWPTLVKVTGGITAEGNPRAICVTFADSSFTGLYPQLAGPPYLFISNPDSPPPQPADQPSLSILGPGPGVTAKELRYYYCISSDHVTSTAICDAKPLEAPAEGTEHNAFYYCLMISGGTQKKSAPGRVVFPAGSSWQINSKVPKGFFASGTLSSEAVYQVLE